MCINGGIHAYLNVYMSLVLWNMHGNIGKRWEHIYYKTSVLLYIYIYRYIEIYKFLDVYILLLYIEIGHFL